MAAALFWMILVALAALVVSVVLRPLWLAAPDMATTDPAQIYRAQLDDIARDLARGTIAEDEAQRLRAEVARRLLDLDRKGAQTPRPPLPRQARLLAAGLVAAFGLGAIGLYAGIGRPDMPDMALADRFAKADEAYRSRPDQPSAEAAAPPYQLEPDPQVLALLEQLREVIKSRPDDQKGLEFLVEYEARVGNFAAAAQAQRHLISLKSAPSAEDHAVLAQNMILAAGEMVTPEAEAELARALGLDPSNPRATYFLGLMFAQVGRPDRTLPLWEGLLITEPETAPWIGPIRAMIGDIAAAAGQRFDMPAPNGPSAVDVEAAAGMQAEERAAMIDNMVSGLEQRLLGQGGSLEEWQQLLQALSVLGDAPRAVRARAAGELAFATNPGALKTLRDFADQLGIAP